MKNKLGVFVAIFAICGSLSFEAFADQTGSGGPGNSGQPDSPKLTLKTLVPITAGMHTTGWLSYYEMEGTAIGCRLVLNNYREKTDATLDAGSDLVLGTPTIQKGSGIIYSFYPATKFRGEELVAPVLNNPNIKEIRCALYDSDATVLNRSEDFFNLVSFLKCNDDPVTGAPAGRSTKVSFDEASIPQLPKL
jgi:hypothetical protein